MNASDATKARPGGVTLAPDVWDRAWAILTTDTSNPDDRYFPSARANQQPPAGDWLVWLILAGRGFGKTRTGAEWLADQVLAQPGTRWAIVAPTYSDCRDTCVEGESGVLAVLERRTRRATWNRSLGELVLENGSRIKLFSADEPERLRGPQHHGAWCDETAAWRYPEAWDQLQFGLRLGEHPRSVVTTTPKPVPLIAGDGKNGRRLGLVHRDGVVTTTGSTFDNADNLSAAALAELRSRYAGTRMGRQELYAELLDDVEGALWTPAMLEAARWDPDVWPDLVEVVVALDPAVTSGENSDETGIVAAGAMPPGWCARCGRLDDGDQHYMVIADESGRMTPDQTMRTAVDLFHELAADVVVVETNNGGDYLESAVRAIDRGVPVRKVTATRGKVLRATPAAMLYEQGRVHHVSGLDDLEQQQTTWTPDSATSPDRLDALVWALTHLARRRAGRWQIVTEAA